MIYVAAHTTKYSYEGPVSHCLSEVRLTPRILPHQQLLEWNLDVEPRAAAILSRRDYFGNDVSSFAVLEPHTKFSVTATSRVEVQSVAYDLAASPAWEAAREEIEEAATPDCFSANEFVWESPYVPWVEGLREYGEESFVPGRPVLEVAEDLMRRIHRDFAYTPKSTSIDTPLEDVLKGRQGVCQDFAHVMIGACRARGVAARYVSGYLRGDVNYEGAQASHAWVSVFSPGFGWLDFDPTNNTVPGTGHLTVAFGRDYGDVTPVKGISVGGGRHKLEVEVRVRPVEAGRRSAW
jgi:transglutaminase-like putative cysteine protease